MSLPTKNPTRYRLSRQVRLLTAKQFRNVFRGSLVSQDAYFRVKAAPNDENYPRLGLAVARRVNKRAVVRNRIKRVVRERFRINKETLKGLDLVVVARQAGADAEKKELAAAIDRHWQQLIETVKKSGANKAARKDYN